MNQGLWRKVLISIIIGQANDVNVFTVYIAGLLARGVLNTHVCWKGVGYLSSTLYYFWNILK